MLSLELVGIGCVHVAAREMSSMRERTRLLYAGWGVFVLSGADLVAGSFAAGLPWRARLPAEEYLDRRMRMCSPRSRRCVSALSISAPVEARELTSSLVGSAAAAAGWLRPFVLLPRDWRSWSGVERRAVLAHEMAHIGRG